MATFDQRRHNFGKQRKLLTDVEVCSENESRHEKTNILVSDLV